MAKIVRKKRNDDTKSKKKYRIVRKKKPKLGFFARVKRFFRNVVVLIAVLAIALSVLGVKTINAAFDRLTKTDIGNSRKELMIANESYNAQKGYDIENIAIFGKDVEDEEGIKRSDTVMILSVNKDTSQIALTSIQRDTYVNIPEYGLNKINMAYFFGDAKLAVQTINANLDTDIKYYVSVDMNALVDIVDSLGGIQLNITETELDEFNLFVDDINYNMGEPYSAKFDTPGTYLCDGRQAMVYARIRKIGNSDFDRTARQRIVLSQIYNKAKENFSIKLLSDMLKSTSEHIETNMPEREIIALAIRVLTSDKGFSTYSLCDEEYIRSAYVEGMQCLIPYYLEDMAEDWHKKIYGEEFVYVPSVQAMECSDKIKNLINNYGLTLEEIYTGDTL